MAAAPKRKVTVGVCGGVAAYKAVELVRALQEAGYDPHVVMTAAAEQFVTALTFAAISGHKVITSLWTGGEVPSGDSSVEHIEEAQTTGALIIIPATASILGKLANGIADDFLTTMYLATPAPVIIAPAMNVVMWQHPAVQANVSTLRARGNTIVEPGAGHLACGMTGSGRLADLNEILSAVSSSLQPFVSFRGEAEESASPSLSSPTFLSSRSAAERSAVSLSAETILITAGGTREPIDGVRFLGNRSSGRMGYALAEEAVSRGARVILVSAPAALPCPPGVEYIPVTTAAEMREAVLHALTRATAVLKAAAVADFRPVHVHAGKRHRSDGLELKLEPTEDIVAEVVTKRQPGTLVVAFAAEMPEPGSDPVERGREKLIRKGVDAIVVNDVSGPDAGFDADRNGGTMLFADHAVEIPQMSKRAMAGRILDEVATLRRFTTAPQEA